MQPVLELPRSKQEKRETRTLSSTVDFSVHTQTRGNKTLKKHSTPAPEAMVCLILI